MTDRFKHTYGVLPPSLKQGDKSTVLVICPSCKNCAEFVSEFQVRTSLTCRSCGFNKQGVDKSECEYWLKTTCCSQSLWASSEKHLDFLEAYISSDLRERLSENWVDRDYLNRLPKWMVIANNRKHVLNCIADLRAKLPDWAVSVTSRAN